MSEWIPNEYDTRPAHGQKVIYLSPYVGRWRGKFDAIGFTFYSEGGFLDGYDVSHWMPDTGQEMPPIPEGYKSAWDK